MTSSGTSPHAWMKFSRLTCKKVCNRVRLQHNPDRKVQTRLLEGIADALKLLNNFAKLDWREICH